MKVELDEIETKKEYKTDVSVLRLPIVEDFLHTVLPNTKFHVAPYEIDDDHGYIHRKVSVTIEWSSDFEETEMVVYLKSGMKFMDYLNYYGKSKDTGHIVGSSVP